MLYHEELNAIIEQIKGRKALLEEELQSLPEGFLHIQKRGDREFYTVRDPKSGNRKKERRHGITRDPELVYSLIRKRYVLNALKIIEKDLRLLEAAFSKYTEFDENSVMGGFIAEHPHLKDAVLRNAGIDIEWSSNYHHAEGLFADDRTSIASDGTIMRSRGEIVVAEKLKQNNIPYRYEMELDHPNLPYIPDFVIKRPRDGKIFFWEHIGDVNDQDYMKRNARKFEVYEEYGIVPWDNLIITYDTINGGVNTPLIEAMIHAWLL